MYNEYPNSQCTDQWQDWVQSCGVTVKPLVVVSLVLQSLCILPNGQHEATEA